MILNFLTISFFFAVSGSVNPTPVDVGYVITVYMNNKPLCTATLISRLWAITTCLCVRTYNYDHLSIRIGDTTIKSKVKHKFYKLNGFYEHPSCVNENRKYRIENDVALLQLAEPFFDSRYVYIVKIPHQLTYWTPDSTLKLDLAVYTDLEDRANRRNEAIWYSSVKLVHPGICLKHFKAKRFVIGKTVCASYFHKGVDYNKCKLDVGAPLTYDYMLIGILAYKVKCGEREGVGSFVNIPYHSQWIRETVRNNTPWIYP